MSYKFTVSVHKGNCSESHLGHNRRTIFVPSADEDRLHLDEAIIDEPIEIAYQKLFGSATEQYNKGKKPSRQIKNYYEHIKAQYEKGEAKLQQAMSSGASKAALRRVKSSYPKMYHELLITVGSSTAHNGLFSSKGEYENITVETLKLFVEKFKADNPQLYVFGCYLHRSESHSHIHLDYIPWTNEKGRGLPKRVSENGAFKQQGLTSGKMGEYGTIAFQKKTRETLAESLSEIAQKHNIEIEIVSGKRGNKEHLSTEEYKVQCQKDEIEKANLIIESQSGKLLQYQDELVRFLKENGIEDTFVQHIEKVALQQDRSELESIKDRNKKILAQSWQEFNEYTSTFFDEYRQNKREVFARLKLARENANCNKRRLNDLLFDITDSTDFLIVKLFKLFCALFVAIDNIRYEKEIERLQEVNNRLKAQAKEVMKQSADVSAVLKAKDFENIEKTLREYDKTLHLATSFIQTTAHTVGLYVDTDIYR